MIEDSDELLNAVREIRDLVRLLAEPAIAERDRKLRENLRKIVGRSGRSAKAVLLMDGSRTQRDIHRQTGIDEGQLSSLVKQLKNSQLLIAKDKPTLAISLPDGFFDAGEKSE